MAMLWRIMEKSKHGDYQRNRSHDAEEHEQAGSPQGIMVHKPAGFVDGRENNQGNHRADPESPFSHPFFHRKPSPIQLFQIGCHT